MTVDIMLLKHTSKAVMGVCMHLSVLTLRDLEMLIDSVTEAAWPSTVPTPIGIPGRVI